MAGFAQALSEHGGSPAQIEEAWCDMAPAYIGGIEAALPNASITFDRYHVMALVNAAVDQVRREEAREIDGLKATRYFWLKSPENLNRGQRRSLASLRQLDLKTARAYHLKLALRRFWEFKYVRAAARYLRRWVWWATHSRLEPMARAARTIRNNWSGVLRFIALRITNGIVEGRNSKIKTALRHAYGFKTFENYRAIIHLVAGKLPLPTRS